MAGLVKILAIFYLVVSPSSSRPIDILGLIKKTQGSEFKPGDPCYDAIVRILKGFSPTTREQIMAHMNQNDSEGYFADNQEGILELLNAVLKKIKLIHEMLVQIGFANSDTVIKEATEDGNMGGHVEGFKYTEATFGDLCADCSLNKLYILQRALDAYLGTHLKGVQNN